MALPHTRLTALTIPPLMDGIWARSGLRVRPMAIDHMPTSTSFFGKAGGTGRPVWSILSMVSMRVGSDPTTLATVRGRPGTVTKMSVGLPTKLNVLVMTYPSGWATRPVEAPTPRRNMTSGPLRPAPQMASAPPDVSMRTTDGATLAAAACMAFSVASLTSWANAGRAKRAMAGRVRRSMSDVSRSRIHHKDTKGTKKTEDKDHKTEDRVGNLSECECSNPARQFSAFFVSFVSLWLICLVSVWAEAPVPC